MLTEQITKASASDQPELHRLWTAVFGDPPEIVQAFFDHFPPDTSGWILRQDGVVCSAAYLIPGNWYLNQSETIPAAYLYAVATLPTMRRKGCAGRLMHAIAEHTRQRNLMLYTRPAEASLFSWYASTLDTGNIGYFQEMYFRKNESTHLLPIRQISPAEYGMMREAFYTEKPHLLMSEHFLRLQEMYSDGFFAVGEGCCCIIKNDRTLQIPELLVPEEEVLSSVQSLLNHFSSLSAHVRFAGTPSNTPGIVYTGETLPQSTNWGFLLE